MIDFFFKLKENPANKKSTWTIGKEYLAIDVDKVKDKIMFVNDTGDFNYVETFQCTFVKLVNNNQTTNQQEGGELNENEEEKRKELLKLIRSEVTKGVNLALKEFEVKLNKEKK